MSKTDNKEVEEETKELRKFELEINPHEVVDAIIKDNKEQCWFVGQKKKSRIVDAWLLGATRAVYYGLPRKNMATDPNKKRGVMNISGLVDRLDLYLVLRIIAYYDKIINTKSDEERLMAHEVVFDLAECQKIAEEYFKSGWIESSESHNFKRICESKFPDTNIVNDFSYELFK